MKILVTGAGNAIGRETAQILAARGEQVLAADRRPPFVAGGRDGGIEPVHLDFENPETFAPALSEVDRVFLQLPMDLPGPEPLERFLENVKACKVRLLVFLSFAGADRNTFPPHHRIEKAIEAAGIPYAHLRTGFLMDNFLTVWSRELLDKDLVYAPGGRTPHAFVSSSDTALAAATVLSDPARFRETAWDLTGPATLTFKETAEVLGRIAGRKIRYKNPGLFAYRNYCAEKKGMGGDALARWVTFFVMAKMGAGKKATGDFTKITGRAPQALEQFLRANQRDWDRS